MRIFRSLVSCSVALVQNARFADRRRSVLTWAWDRCPKTSQATRNGEGKASTMPAVVAGLCIIGGVAAVAGGLGLGMGLEEEEAEN